MNQNILALEYLPTTYICYNEIEVLEYSQRLNLPLLIQDLARTKAVSICYSLDEVEIMLGYFSFSKSPLIIQEYLFHARQYLAYLDVKEGQVNGFFVTEILEGFNIKNKESFEFFPTNTLTTALKNQIYEISNRLVKTANLSNDNYSLHFLVAKNGKAKVYLLKSLSKPFKALETTFLIPTQNSYEKIQAPSFYEGLKLILKYYSQNSFNNEAKERLLSIFCKLSQGTSISEIIAFYGIAKENILEIEKIAKEEVYCQSHFG